MTKIVDKYIEDCGDCPHYSYTRFQSRGEHLCTKRQAPPGIIDARDGLRIIPSGVLIPSWCPLPDKEV